MSLYVGDRAVCRFRWNFSLNIDGKRQFSTPMRKWEDNIKMDLTEIWMVEWINLMSLS